MGKRVPDLRRGRIVWARVKDPRGQEKLRPALILTPTDEIADESPLVLMAITTTFVDPPPDGHVELPWTARGHKITWLKRRSAAVVTWLVEATTDSIEELGGEVPKKHLAFIDLKLAKLSG